MSFQRVPDEILDHIAFHLAAISPFPLPDPLLPLRYASKSLNLRLSPHENHSLYAHIYRLKFDDSAVRRRAFTPEAENYADQYVHSCKALAAIKHRDFEADDPGPVLFAAYIMMLDNDGKNRAQLEVAGIELYLDVFVRTHMYNPLLRATNNGWPQDTAANACALWLMWMFTTPEKLHAESIEEREQITQLVLPFASIPFRYTSAYAPPMHYVLPPINPATDEDDNLFSIQTAHGDYPIYRRPERAWSQVYYGSRPLLTYPLAAEAAKLVYQSRRDMALLTVPPHHPRTRADAIASGITGVFPTQEDVAEVNAHKSAQVVKRVIWDWDRDIAFVPGEEHSSQHIEASRAWDCDWWRLRLCWDIWKNQPRWKPGRVYVPGSLSGLWQGKMLIPSELQMMAFLHNPSYPSPFFSETTLSITSRPIFMRLTEHHCLVDQPPMPVPRQKIGPFQDDGVQNAWFPGPLGSLRWDTFLDQNDRRHAMFYTPNGHTAQYQTYEPSTSGSDWSGLQHDRDSCSGCRTRAELINAAVFEERLAFEEEQRREAEKTFSSIGLGRENTVSFQFGDSDMNIDGEDDEEDDGYSDVMDEIEHNAIDVDLPPVRKTHDWVRNVVQCDGVTDVMVTGATDDVHGQAWHHYTYYGRVRPWDGLIGILRVQRGFFQGTSILYGYISGGKNFSGNWRWALADPSMPAWECAVVMSKREE